MTAVISFGRGGRGGYRRWRVLGLATLCCLTTACAAPEYNTRHYALSASDEAPAEAEPDYVLGVGPVRLPDMLDRSQIVSHDGGQRVHLSHQHIWAGDLREMVTRVLADSLSNRLGSDQVWPFPWSGGMRPERQLTLVLERFGGERGGQVSLQAKWRLLSGGGNIEHAAEKISLHTDTADGSYGAYVEALNRLLNQLAEAIAGSLLAQQDGD